LWQASNVTSGPGDLEPGAEVPWRCQERHADGRRDAGGVAGRDVEAARE
jgi:hypothetical protein